jgi:AraC-like DNA-binding protein
MNKRGEPVYHVPIVKTENASNKVEISHIIADLPPNFWERNNTVCVGDIKIKMFCEGDFSIIVDGLCYFPEYGNVCVFPPYKMHGAQNLNRTHNDYYQLNIGTAAFDGVPGGRELLEQLVSLSESHGVFAKPSKTDSMYVMQLCGKLEAHVSNLEYTLAFTTTVEIISKLTEIYAKGANAQPIVLSRPVREIMKFVEENYGKRITVSDVSEALFMSPSYLSRLFKREVGIGIHEYLSKYRILQASRLLVDNGVNDVCYMCGFSDSSHFITAFKKHFGKTPREYQKEITEK